MRKPLSVLLFLGLSLSVSAKPISLEYEGFYARLKQLNSGNYPLVDIAFSVPETNGCTIKTGFIATEKERFPLVIASHQRLLIPFDDSLKSNRATINLQMKDNAQQCGIAMQIRAKQTKKYYAQADLIALQQEMNALLRKLQGFPMRYFMADINGVSFQFEQPTTVILDGETQEIETRFNLSADQVSKLSHLEFSRQPRVVSPWIK